MTSATESSVRSGKKPAGIQAAFSMLDLNDEAVSEAYSSVTVIRDEITLTMLKAYHVDKSHDYRYKDSFPVKPRVGDGDDENDEDKENEKPTTLLRAESADFIPGLDLDVSLNRVDSGTTSAKPVQPTIHVPTPKTNAFAFAKPINARPFTVVEFKLDGPDFSTDSHQASSRYVLVKNAPCGFVGHYLNTVCLVHVSEYLTTR